MCIVIDAVLAAVVITTIALTMVTATGTTIFETISAMVRKDDQQAACGKLFAAAGKWGMKLLAGILLCEFPVILASTSVDGHVLIGNVFETVPCIARNRTPLTQPCALSVDQGCIHTDTCIADINRNQCNFTEVSSELSDNVSNCCHGRARCPTTNANITTTIYYY